VTTSVSLDGAKSYDPDFPNSNSALQFSWFSNCPNAHFSSTSSPTPLLTLNSESLNGIPTSCLVTLVVNDGVESSSCEASVTVAGCIKDCAGIINGLRVFDVCGKCEGDGLACLDCAGLPFGTKKVDRCGVCDGDGSSCLGCVSKDVKSNLTILDNAAFRLSQAITKRLGKFKALSRSSAVSKFVSKAGTEANNLYKNSWSLAWSIPVSITQCTNVIFCKPLDFTSTKDAYLSNMIKLRDLAKKVNNQLRKLRGQKHPSDKPFTKRVNDLYQEGVGELKAIPDSESFCN